MGKVVDFSTAREARQWQRKEARLAALRRAFRAARQSWENEDKAESGRDKPNRRKNGKNKRTRRKK